MKTVFCKSALPKTTVSLHNSAVVCLRQKLCRGLPENLTFQHYTLVSLNFTLSVSEYVTINVKVKSVIQRFCSNQITAVGYCGLSRVQPLNYIVSRQ